MTYSDYRNWKLKSLSLIDKAYMKMFISNKKVMKKEYFTDFLRMQEMENKWMDEFLLEKAVIENKGAWKRDNYSDRRAV